MEQFIGVLILVLLIIFNAKKQIKKEKARQIVRQQNQRPAVVEEKEFEDPATAMSIPSTAPILSSSSYDDVSEKYNTSELNKYLEQNRIESSGKKIEKQILTSEFCTEEEFDFSAQSMEEEEEKEKISFNFSLREAMIYQTILERKYN
ncbi:MAG: hypothetical protein RRX93_05420 [Bacteroidales bacterium]